MKVIIVSKNAAEASERLAPEHRAIPVIAQATNQSLLSAIERHRSDVALIYLESATLIFAVGERLVWETVERINALLGDRRKEVMVVIGWEDEINTHVRHSFVQRLTGLRVNLVAVGKRDPIGITNLIRNLAAQFGAYLEHHAAIIGEEPRGEPRGRRSPGRKGGDQPRPPENSVFALSGEPFRAEARDPVPPDPPGDSESAPAVLPPSPERAESSETRKEGGAKQIDERSLELAIDLDLIEKAFHAGIVEMFRVLRSGIPTEGTPSRADRDGPKTDSPLSVEPRPVGARFTLDIVKGSDPSLADRAPELIRINGVEIATTRRVRRVLEVIRSQGVCPASIAGSGTRSALYQFVHAANQKLMPASIRLGIQNETIRLH